jgi:hypothetical protein
MKHVAMAFAVIIHAALQMRSAVGITAASLLKPVVMIPAVVPMKFVAIIQNAALQMRVAVGITAALLMKLAAIIPLAV